MLEARGLDYSRVLDLYAGTGALGIEALSRQASWADFVETNPRRCAEIRDNLKAMGLPGRVYCARVERALSFLTQPYDLILMDPPYAQPDLPARLERLMHYPAVGEDTVIAVAHSSRQPLPATCGPFRQVVSRRHGDTTLSIYRRGDGLG